MLVVHNRYREAGGEDAVFRAEKALLGRMGAEVVELVEDNARLEGIHPLRAAVEAVWSRRAYRRVAELVRAARPDVAHFHNTFVRISPAAYWACWEAGVPVVQTLHNYRLVCPGALLLRRGRVCEACLGRAVPWTGVVHGCWRGSRAGTGVVAAMLAAHRALGTWREKVDLYIALTEFARRKLIEGGLPAERLVVKPNFVHPDPGPGEHRVDFALFAGRLAPEKGVRTLLAAWRHLPGIPLKVVGDGPLAGEMRAVAALEGLRGIELLGRLPREAIFGLMRRARVLVFPSEWYEGFPLTLAEAFACGLPVVASRLGAVDEIVEEGRTGLLFEPGDPEDLAARIEWAWSHPEAMAAMGREARRVYELEYTAGRNHERLMRIYALARERRGAAA